MRDENGSDGRENLNAFSPQSILVLENELIQERLLSEEIREVSVGQDVPRFAALFVVEHLRCFKSVS